MARDVAKIRLSDSPEPYARLNFFDLRWYRKKDPDEDPSTMNSESGWVLCDSEKDGP